jgi:sugar lactone lactonase YvrE
MWNNIRPDGTDGEASGKDGVLYRIDPNGQSRIWERGIGIANTVAWTPDNRSFYFGDSLANSVYSYDYNASDGSITNRRPFLVGFPRGLPDGSAVDSNGYLWNCRYDGGCIVRVAPNTEIDRVVEFPTSKPTSCTFGGENLDTLYVTSSSLGTTGDRIAGGLFALKPGVQGLRENWYAAII